jgi:hypothetical protein
MTAWGTAAGPLGRRTPAGRGLAAGSAARCHALVAPLTSGRRAIAAAGGAAGGGPGPAIYS